MSFKTMHEKNIIISCELSEYHTHYCRVLEIKKRGIEANYLKSELEKRLPAGSSGLSIPDLCNTIFDTLSSTRADDHIQNEVTVSYNVSGKQHSHNATTDPIPGHSLLLIKLIAYICYITSISNL